MRYVQKWLLWLCLLSSGGVFAQSFVVNDIFVEGLQRVSLGSVLAALSVREGETADESDASQWLREIYKTGYFHDVSAEREGNNLVFRVSERPAINSVDFSGNDSIPSSTLDTVFADLGLVEGEIFSRSLVESIDLELEKQYGAQGRYNAGVDVEVVPRTRNRVDIELDITEGPVAEVYHIEFIGNAVYDDEQLLEVMRLEEDGSGGLIAAFLKRDRFSNAALAGDLQRLEDWYFDHGYLDYEVASEQVMISEDKAEVSIALNMSEGAPYQISGIEITGDLKHLSQQLTEKMVLNVGDTYSRSDVSQVIKEMTDVLGENGYAFATVRDFRKKQTSDQTVGIVFQVDMGLPVYVNRILIEGNVSTNDEVIRRELRQLERGLLINSKVNLSRARLQRLGYFSSVNIRTERLPDYDDLVDLVVSVVEAKDSRLNISGGYAAGSGFFAEFSLTQNNFMGLGIDFSATVNVDSSTQNYQLSIENPYFTLDGVSLGADVFYRKSDYSDLTSSAYASNSYGARVNLGYPLSENQRVTYGLGASETELFLSDSAPLEMTDFIEENGDLYTITTARLGWSYNTVNGTIKADDGASVTANLEVSVPPGDLRYYIATLGAQNYFNIADDLAFRIHTELGYGEGYGGYSLLPFYRHFYSGGSRSVRGFRRASLGPLGTPETDVNGDALYDASPIGGNIKVEYGAELIFPTPLVENKDAYRTSLFIDAGNVFSDQCRSDNSSCTNGVDFSDIRYSVGLDFTWITPIAPLSFSYAFPLNARDSDEIARFAFNIGVSY